jgi:tRNA (guanine26-N2/guanine27-N2)-dimethyltransferase
MSTGVSSITVPDGFALHTENTSHILLPTSNEAFLNPVQEFNRDMSVACITVWSEELNRFKEERWRQTQERHEKKGKDGPDAKRSKSAFADRLPRKLCSVTV